jgi:hypothetical protein
MKKDHLAEKEYRYGCSIDCGGTRLRVYARDLDSEDPWVSVEDYLQAGNALGYGSRWQIRYDAGAFLMAGTEPEEQYMAYVDNEGLPVVQELTPCVLQETQPANTVPCPPLLEDVCPGDSNLMQIYGLYSCTGEDRACAGSGNGDGPDTDWCKRNRESPSAVNCQDCCDQKVIERIKKLPKDQCKKLKECIQEKCRDAGGDRAECVKGCLVEVLGTLKAFPLLAKLDRYLKCCYSKCLPGGHFDPPGNCKLPI